MDSHSVNLITFSPTGTTRKIVEAIAQGTGLAAAGRIDLTPPVAKTGPVVDVRGALAIIGAPVYGGRLPREAVRRLRRVRGDGTPAVVVAVYGNRAYEDALIELRDLAVEQGFRPVAAGAFIGEHSYDSETTPIATGRPDAADLEAARAFGGAVRRKLARLPSSGEFPPLDVPGDVPYKTWDPPAGAPVTDRALCILCGACASACPAAAVTVEETVVTDADACILCSACVKACPTGARAWDTPWLMDVATWLSENFRERKEPETSM